MQAIPTSLSRDLDEAAELERWRQIRATSWVPFRLRALWPTAAALGALVASLAVATSRTGGAGPVVSGWGLLALVGFAIGYVRQYHAFFRSFGTGRRRRSHVRRLVAFAFHTPRGDLPREPPRIPGRPRRGREPLTRGPEARRLQHARQWAAATVANDLSLTLLTLTGVTSLILNLLWSRGLVATDLRPRPDSAPTIAGDLTVQILRVVPLVDLSETFGLSRSQVYETDLRYRVVLLAFTLAVVVPTVGSILSLAGTIRMCDPLRLVEDDPVVGAVVRELTSRDAFELRRVVRDDTTGEEVVAEVVPSPSWLLLDVRSAVERAASTLNRDGVIHPSDQAADWTADDVVAHVSRVGVFR